MSRPMRAAATTTAPTAMPPLAPVDRPVELVELSRSFLLWSVSKVTWARDVYKSAVLPLGMEYDPTRENPVQVLSATSAATQPTFCQHSAKHSEMLYSSPSLVSPKVVCPSKLAAQSHVVEPHCLVQRRPSLADYAKLEDKMRRLSGSSSPDMVWVSSLLCFGWKKTQTLLYCLLGVVFARDWRSRAWPEMRFEILRTSHREVDRYNFLHRNMMVERQL